MTRINAGIPPKKLIDSHLMAEHREIIRIPNLFVKRLHSGNGFKDCPKLFTLNTGHVKFFYPLGEYTHDRYLELYFECRARRFDVKDYRGAWQVYHNSIEYYNDYEPTAECILAVQQRIAKNIMESTQVPRYYGEKISLFTAVSLLVN